MALIKSGVLFRVFPAECSNELKVSLRPNEHCKTNDDGKVYIEYTCQLCESLTEKANQFIFGFKREDKFNLVTLPKGIKQCPCCGINIDWDYK